MYVMEYDLSSEASKSVIYRHMDDLLVLYAEMAPRWHH
jgi:hypothetical protein